MAENAGSSEEPSSPQPGSEPSSADADGWMKADSDIWIETESIRSSEGLRRESATGEEAQRVEIRRMVERDGE